MANTDWKETVWQSAWEKKRAFKMKKTGKKFYCLEMFPYPSGKLHMGHVRNYSIGDALARFKRMNGYSVLYPMGFDSFGLPAENAAIKAKIDPREWTEKNIQSMASQQKRLGFSYDWERKIATHEPEYYKWNQWFFLQFLKKGLAYKKKASVNWCPSCQTVLANEQVENGHCWRCDSVVTQKELEQWFFRITAYAQELLDGIDTLSGWPERVRLMQKNWIGKSIGVAINFPIDNSNETITAFTTRPDTIYSVTFLAVAPEHKLAKELAKGTPNETASIELIEKMKNQSLIERSSPEGKNKEGFFTGKYAKNPVNGERIPLWVANFVLPDYGMGIVMADAHDQRDFEFAKKYGIPLKMVISPTGTPIDPYQATEAFTQDGILYGSGEFSGMENQKAIPLISNWIEQKGFGKKQVFFRIRDWLLSRQRFWGTPIPIIYCDKCGTVPVPEKDLPVLLPKKAEFTGTGNPLEKAREFVNAKCPNCRSPARRETDTMDTFVDSSWYFFRYCSPHEKKAPFEKKSTQKMAPVNQYIGGIEHAVLHLLYARFFTKALRDLGLVKIDEPFERLLAQGMVIKDGLKMSKSYGNVVSPEEIIDKYGADTARFFMLFSALPEKELDWSEQGVQAAYRFLKKTFELSKDKKIGFGKPNAKKLSMQGRLVLSKTTRTIIEVTQRVENFELNFALSEIMTLVNEVHSSTGLDKNVKGYATKTIALLLNPFCPHVSESMWKELGQKGFSSLAKWPIADKKLIDVKAETMHELVENTRQDTRKVIELSKISSPKKITFFTAPEWKWKAVEELKKQKISKPDFSLIMKTLFSNPQFREKGKQTEALAKFFMQRISYYNDKGQINELAALNEARKLLGKEFGCEIVVLSADKALPEQTQKASNAQPLKPAILVE
ncbi:MAG: leucine--tRNA ligase [archaeon]|nr:leucine--tRNA ligase [archaeon]